jgi:quinol monooxygenase YgiN
LNLMYAMFATLKVKAGHADEFERLLSELAVPTRAEQGTKLYVFGRSTEPDTFLMMERYDDKNALKAHYSSAHFQRLAPKLALCLDGEPSAIRFTEIGT